MRMNTPIRQYFTRDEADKIRCSRGFKSFNHWAVENRKGVNLHKLRKQEALVNALEREYDSLIKPNL
jgi:hypothetical protein